MQICHGGLRINRNNRDQYIFEDTIQSSVFMWFLHGIKGGSFTDKLIKSDIYNAFNYTHPSLRINNTWICIYNTVWLTLPIQAKDDGHSTWVGFVNLSDNDKLLIEDEAKANGNMLLLQWINNPKHGSTYQYEYTN